MIQLTEQELNSFRAIRIHKILGIRDDGRGVLVRCVFHTDSTPSLSLSPDNLYHCFGCNKSGSGAIDFCRDLGYGFKESLEELLKYL